MSLLFDDAPDESRQLHNLLDQVAARGQKAKFWWRDDDARNNGPKLQKLYAISRETSTPLVLAVIPDGCDASILEEMPEDTCIFQHGVVHQQLQEPGAKKCEFPLSRPAREIFAALNTGREALTKHYGDRFRPCLVPPWNRFPDKHKDILPKAGFSHLSRYKSPNPKFLQPNLSEINTHIDIIDWKSRTFLGTAACLQLVIDHLDDKLSGKCPAAEVSGILSHHIDHDPGCDAFLHAFFTFIHRHPVTETISGQDLTA